MLGYIELHAGKIRLPLSAWSTFPSHVVEKLCKCISKKIIRSIKFLLIFDFIMLHRDADNYPCREYFVYIEQFQWSSLWMRHSTKHTVFYNNLMNFSQMTDF